MNKTYVESHEVLKVSFQQLQHVVFIAKAEKMSDFKVIYWHLYVNVDDGTCSNQ